MSSAPTNPIDIPPFGLENILKINDILGPDVSITCAQALGSEIYLGCSNGHLWRFALQADSPDQLESYHPLSELAVSPQEKSIDEIVIVPSILRALVLCDQTLYFYHIPSLEPVSYSQIRPLRNIITFAVDNNHLKRPPPLPGTTPGPGGAVEFSAIKRGAIVVSKLTIAGFAMREKMVAQREVPCPEKVTKAVRVGRTLCVADAENYNVINLDSMECLPFIPICQALDRPPDFSGKPQIIVINEEEFLVASWMPDGNTLGVFVTTRGDPVRGTLQWPDYPESLSLDYPYVTALLPNQTIEIHNIEQDQAIAQVVSASLDAGINHRTAISSVFHGYMVPSHERSEKMALKKVKLLRGMGDSDPRPITVEAET